MSCTLTRRDNTVPARECATIADAMTAAGRLDADDWIVAAGVPRRIFTHWIAEYQDGADVSADDGDDEKHLRRFWEITGDGVAHELIGMLTAGQVTGRTWSKWDRQVAHLGLIELSYPRDCARACAARIAAHLAVSGGTITHGQITAAELWAYLGADTLPDAEVTNGAVRIGNALHAAGFVVERPGELSELGIADIVPTMRRPASPFART